MSSTSWQRAYVIGAFAWGTMTDAEKRDAIQHGVLVAMAPHQWEAMMQEQKLASGAKDNLREELRVSKLNVDRATERFRNEQARTMQVQSELETAQDHARLFARAMHGLVDGITGTRVDANGKPRGLTPQEAYAIATYDQHSKG